MLSAILLLNAISVLVLGCLGLCSLVIVPTILRLLRASGAEEISPEWLENFSVKAYAPMEHLLGDEDFRFLSRQPGFDLKLYRKLRKERLAIFKQYLYRMIVDFNRLHLVARLTIAQSQEDQSELLARLVTLKMRFYLAVLRAQCCYWLAYFNVRTVTVRFLTAELEALSLQVVAANPA
jgi:hypothetical protein